MFRDFWWLLKIDIWEELKFKLMFWGGPFLKFNLIEHFRNHAELDFKPAPKLVPFNLSIMGSKSAQNKMSKMLSNWLLSCSNYWTHNLPEQRIQPSNLIPHFQREWNKPPKPHSLRSESPISVSTRISWPLLMKWMRNQGSWELRKKSKQDCRPTPTQEDNICEIICNLFSSINHGPLVGVTWGLRSAICLSND